MYNSLLNTYVPHLNISLAIKIDGREKRESPKKKAAVRQRVTKLEKKIDLENLPAVCMTDSSICGGFLMADIDCPLNDEKGCIYRDWVLMEDIS